MSSTQRLLDNSDNVVVDAELSASSTKTVADAAISMPTARQGNANITVTGSYTGVDEALVDIVVVDNNASDEPLLSTPSFSGVGSGSLQVGNVSGQAQEFTVTLKSLGSSLLEASALFEGLHLSAKVAGSGGNAIAIFTDYSTYSFNLSGYAVNNDIAANADLYLDQALDFDAKPMDTTGDIPSNAHRLVFSTDTNTVYRQYKKFVSGVWQYAFEPKIKEQVKKGAQVLFVSNGVTVTITNGTDTEVYPNITSQYQLFTAIRDTSQLVSIEGIIVEDRKPSGQAVTEVTTRTTGYALPTSGTGSDYAKGFVDIVIGNNASTELIEAKCIAANRGDNPDAYLGHELWELRGSVSGTLVAELPTDTLYNHPTGKFSLRVPKKLPPSFTPVTPDDAITLVGVNYAGGTRQGANPPICIRNKKTGTRVVERNLTLTYRKKKSTVNCDCGVVALPELSTQWLTGQVPAIQQSGVYPMTIAPRVRDAYSWRNDIYQCIFDGKPDMTPDRIKSLMSSFEATFTKVISLLIEVATSPDNILYRWDELFTDFKEKWKSTLNLYGLCKDGSIAVKRMVVRHIPVDSAGDMLGFSVTASSQILYFGSANPTGIDPVTVTYTYNSTTGAVTPDSLGFKPLQEIVCISIEDSNITNVKHPIVYTVEAGQVSLFQTGVVPTSLWLKNLSEDTALDGWVVGSNTATANTNAEYAFVAQDGTQYFTYYVEQATAVAETTNRLKSEVVAVDNAGVAQLQLPDNAIYLGMSFDLKYGTTYEPFELALLSENIVSYNISPTGLLTAVLTGTGFDSVYVSYLVESADTALPKAVLSTDTDPATLINPNVFPIKFIPLNNVSYASYNPYSATVEIIQTGGTPSGSAAVLMLYKTFNEAEMSVTTLGTVVGAGVVTEIDTTSPKAKFIFTASDELVSNDILRLPHLFYEAVTVYDSSLVPVKLTKDTHYELTSPEEGTITLLDLADFSLPLKVVYTALRSLVLDSKVLKQGINDHDLEAGKVYDLGSNIKYLQTSSAYQEGVEYSLNTGNGKYTVLVTQDPQAPVEVTDRMVNTTYGADSEGSINYGTGFFPLSLTVKDSTDTVISQKVFNSSNPTDGMSTVNSLKEFIELYTVANPVSGDSVKVTYNAILPDTVTEVIDEVKPYETKTVIAGLLPRFLQLSANGGETFTAPVTTDSGEWFGNFKATMSSFFSLLQLTRMDVSNIVIKDGFDKVVDSSIYTYDIDTNKIVFNWALATTVYRLPITVYFKANMLYKYSENAYDAKVMVLPNPDSTVDNLSTSTISPKVIIPIESVITGVIYAYFENSTYVPSSYSTINRPAINVNYDTPELQIWPTNANSVINSRVVTPVGMNSRVSFIENTGKIVLNGVSNWYEAVTGTDFDITTQTVTTSSTTLYAANFGVLAYFTGSYTQNFTGIADFTRNLYDEMSYTTSDISNMPALDISGFTQTTSQTIQGMFSVVDMPLDQYLTLPHCLIDDYVAYLIPDYSVPTQPISPAHILVTASIDLIYTRLDVVTNTVIDNLQLRPRAVLKLNPAFLHLYTLKLPVAGYLNYYRGVDYVLAVKCINHIVATTPTGNLADVDITAAYYSSVYDLPNQTNYNFIGYNNAFANRRNVKPSNIYGAGLDLDSEAFILHYKSDANSDITYDYDQLYVTLKYITFLPSTGQYQTHNMDISADCLVFSDRVPQQGYTSNKGYVVYLGSIKQMIQDDFDLNLSSLGHVLQPSYAIDCKMSKEYSYTTTKTSFVNQAQDPVVEFKVAGYVYAPATSVPIPKWYFDNNWFNQVAGQASSSTSSSWSPDLSGGNSGILPAGWFRQYPPIFESTTGGTVALVSVVNPYGSNVSALLQGKGTLNVDVFVAGTGIPPSLNNPTPPVNQLNPNGNSIEKGKFGLQIMESADLAFQVLNDYSNGIELFTFRVVDDSLVAMALEQSTFANNYQPFGSAPALSLLPAGAEINGYNFQKPRYFDIPDSWLTEATEYSSYADLATNKLFNVWDIDVKDDNGNSIPKGLYKLALELKPANQPYINGVNAVLPVEPYDVEIGDRDLILVGREIPTTNDISIYTKQGLIKAIKKANFTVILRFIAPLPSWVVFNGTNGLKVSYKRKTYKTVAVEEQTTTLDDFGTARRRTVALVNNVDSTKPVTANYFDGTDWQPIVGASYSSSDDTISVIVNSTSQYAGQWQVSYTKLPSLNETHIETLSFYRAALNFTDLGGAKYYDVNLLQPPLDTGGGGTGSTGTGANSTIFLPFEERVLAYDAWIDEIRVLSGKLHAQLPETANDDLLVGGWANSSNTYYWEVKTNVPIKRTDDSVAGFTYAPAFTGEQFYACVQREGTGDPDDRFSGTMEATLEFGFIIEVTCAASLLEGDTINIAIGNSGWPSTYKVDDTLTLPIVSANPVVLAGGADGDNVQTWSVKGSVSGDLPDYLLDRDLNNAYTIAVPIDLSFSIAQGAIAYGVGDYFKFKVEGGHIKYRVNGGAYSLPVPVTSTPIPLTLGLEALVQLGSTPSLVANDTYSFTVIQPYAVSNVITPDRDGWIFDSNLVTLSTVFDAPHLVDGLAIAYHTLPENAVITFTGKLAGMTVLVDTLPVTKGVCVALFEAITLDELEISISGGANAKIGWLWVGRTKSLSASADVVLSKDYNLKRNSTKAQYLGRAVSGTLDWKDSCLTEDDISTLKNMLDYLKSNDDEPLIIVPHEFHTSEAFIAHVVDDSINFKEEFSYQPDDMDNRRYSVTLNIKGEFFS